MQACSTELHLCIVWDRARAREAEIVDRIRRSFRIRAAFEIHWSAGRFSDNLTRFYGKKLPPGCEKHVHCGEGPFLLVVFEDERPEYAERDTLAGVEIVNTRVFDFKQHYRSQAQGGLPLHTTNNPQETEHDLYLLLGQTTAQFNAEMAGREWDGEAPSLKRDLTGAEGWPDLPTLFEALNATGRYVVLRNFEGLPGLPDADHGDIDLLCEDLSLALIANGRKVFEREHSVHYLVPVGERTIPFDFRYLGDGYYCTALESAILEQRELDPRGFFRPTPEHYFYSLLYHAILHKPAFRPDYVDKLNAIAAAAGVRACLTPNRLHALTLLDNYLARQGYDYTHPHDETVPLEAGLLDTYFQALHIDSLDSMAAIRAGIRRDPAPSPAVENPGGRIRQHFNPLRPNVLQPFAAHLKGRVLEIGAGSGVLTRFLGEAGATVVAVEPSDRLRGLASERCVGLDNVELIDTVPDEVSFRQSFDAVVLVGQLFCKARFGNATCNEAAGSLLERLGALLRPEGVMVLAEANALGIDQLAAVDSVDGSGLVGRAAEAQRHGRAELERLLVQAGFQDRAWYYPFPDHLDARSIVAADTLDDPAFDAVTLICGSAGSQPGARASLPFPLEAAWSSAGRNHLIGELANAFIVAAAPRRAPRTGDGALAFHYANERPPCHAKEVRFFRDAGQLRVRHRRLFPMAPLPAEHSVAVREFDEPYVVGTHWQLDLVRRLSMPGWRYSTLEDWARVWFDALRRHPDFPRAVDDLRADTPVCGSLVDAIGRNLIIDAAGDPHFIDQEWVLDAPVPLGYVLFRGILLSLMSVPRVAPPCGGTPTNAAGIFMHLASLLGLPIPPDALDRYVALEQRFQEEASGWRWASLSRVREFELRVVSTAAGERPAQDRSKPPSERREPAAPLLDPDREAYRTVTASTASGSEQRVVELIRLAEQGSSWWEVYNDLGVEAFQRGSIEDAVHLLTAASAREPAADDATFNLAKLRLLQGLRDDALSLLGRVARAHPERADVLAEIRFALSGYDEIPPVVWARLMSDLRAAPDTPEATRANRSMRNP